MASSENHEKVDQENKPQVNSSNELYYTIPNFAGNKLGEGECSTGLAGTYSPIENDFNSVFTISKESQLKFGQDRPPAGKFRFLVSFLCLVSLAIGSISRMALNVSIVDMLEPIGPEVPAVETTTFDGLLITNPPERTDLDETYSNVEKTIEHSSVQEQNMVISAFFFGYMPMLLLGGNLADVYGSKGLILTALILTAIISVLTPFLAQFSIPCLVASRVLLGLVQGPLVPSAYDLFNRWLTATEIGVIAPMIKVAFGSGGAIGTLLPGVAQVLGLTWRAAFYTTSFIAASVALIWFLMVSSNPADNTNLKPAELKRIQRKKTNNAPSNERLQTPWLKIVTNPSVLALTLVKLCYNIGLDFFVLEIAIYMRNIHDAPVKLISIVLSAVCTLHLLFIGLVGWMAKEVVQRKSFGFGKTAWRKIFQGVSNFGMAAAYLAMPIFAHNNALLFAVFSIVPVCYMFGAGGESLGPFDLSARYPATIMGLAHSISVLSGIIIPGATSLIVQDSPEDPERWNILFNLVGITLLVGGLIFVLVFKAKPFLAEEQSSGTRLARA